MLAAVDGPFDLVTANPPYLTDAVVDSMKGRGWPEPDIALRGGRNGLDLCDRLIEQARVKLLRSGILLMEADPQQMPSLESAMKRAGYVSIRILEDMRGHRRVIHGSVG
jgi:release factor glutamine methyltransferase